MIQDIDDLITEIFDEYPRPRLICNTPGDYTPRLVSQLNLKRSTRTKLTPPRSHICSRPAQQEARPTDCQRDLHGMYGLRSQG